MSIPLVNKKIFFVAQGLNGGIASATSQLAINLNKDGWTPFVVFVGRPAKNNNKVLLLSNGVQCLEIVTSHRRSTGEVINILRSIRTISKQATSFEPDVIVLSGIIPAIFYAPILKLRMSKPIVIWEHGPQLSYSSIKKYLFYFSNFFIDSHISVSKSSNVFYTSLFSYVDVNKSTIIENAVDFSTYDRQDLSKDDAFAFLNIIVIARLDLFQKDHRTIIKAASLLKANNIPFHIDFAGDGPDKSLLSNFIVKMGLSGQITILGQVEYIPQLLSKYNICCLSTKYEGGPSLAIIEGFASGLLCIASDVIGVSDAITNGHNGILFEYNNHEQLSSKLIWIINNPLQSSQIANTGYQEGLVRFDSKCQTSKFGSHLSKMLALK
ncbi:MAG: glycosyltransferase [Nitrospirae bacterium]|nr:glycosyltransferase [Nitrospirota bacterium]